MYGGNVLSAVLQKHRSFAMYLLACHEINKLSLIKRLKRGRKKCRRHMRFGYPGLGSGVSCPSAREYGPKFCRNGQMFVKFNVSSESF